MSKILKWGLIAIVIGIVVLIILRYLQCRKRGKESGQHYKCNILCSDPDYMELETEYYMMRERKCYHVIDFGDNMSIRRVSLEMCGMKEEPKVSTGVEDAVYF